MGKFRNNLRIAFSSLKSNQKTILLTTVGLTIALSVSFQMLLFLLGSKGALLDTFLSGQYEYGLFGGVLEDEPIPLNLGPDYEAHFSKIGFPDESLDAKLREDVFNIEEEFRVKDFVTSTRLCSYNNIYLYIQPTITSEPIQKEVLLIGLSKEDLQFISPFLLTADIEDLDENNTILIYLESQSPIYIPLDLQFNVSHALSPSYSNVTLLDVPFDISGFGSGYNTIYKMFLRRFGITLIGYEEIIMITTLEGANGLLEKMNIHPYYLMTDYFLNIDISYSKFGIFSENRDLAKVRDFRNLLSTNRMEEAQLYFDYVFDRIHYNMGFFYEDNFNIIQLIILTLTLPPICIAFFMINFSFNLVRTQNIHHINLLKTRGATNNQIFLALFLEMIVSSIFSIILGSAIGIPLLLLISRTSGFMEFKSELEISQYSLSVAGTLVLIILIAGIVLSLLINLPRMFRMSNLKVRNIAGEEERKRKPLWVLLKLDRALGALAIISLIIYLVAIEYTTGNLQMLLMMIFGSATPILLVVSISFLISRQLSPRIKRYGNKLWSKNGGTFALSFKNLSYKEKQTTRAVILMVITLTFGIVSSVVPSTIDYNTKQRWEYVLGADVVILGFWGDQNEIDSILAINGVESVTRVILNEDVIINTGFGPLATSVIGIDPDTFLDAAFIQRSRYGFSNFVSILMNDLEVTDNVLVQRNNLRDSDLRIGDDFSTYSSNYNIVGSFKFFPNLVKDKILPRQINHKYIVGSIETIEKLLLEEGSYTSSSILYIKQSKLNTGKIIKDEVKNLFPSYTVYSAEEGTENDLKMPARLAVYAMLNSSFLTTMISTLAGFSIYSFLILFDRSKELALIRALGANKKEIFKAFIYESNLLLLIGIILGIPVGIGTSAIVSNIITSYYEIPPLVLDIPWLALFVLVILILLITTAGACIPGYFATKQEINELSRAT